MSNNLDAAYRLKRNTSGLVAPKGDWLSSLRCYFVVVAVGNLAWEIAQLPLFTIWHDGSANQIAFAVLHCTGGDVLVAGAVLIGALVVVGNGGWPYERFRSVAAIALIVGLAFTVFNEWLNTEIRQSWTYTTFMPRLPLVGTGVSPVMQWILVPVAAFWWASRPATAWRERHDS